MDTQTAGYQNKFLGAVAQTDYTDGFVCLRRRKICWKIWENFFPSFRTKFLSSFYLISLA